MFAVSVCLSREGEEPGRDERERVDTSPTRPAWHWQGTQRNPLGHQAGETAAKQVEAESSERRPKHIEV
jgi:hypothetical protein